jgi:pimeloyl-ACP methyl ester carboxylesterase
MYDQERATSQDRCARTFTTKDGQVIGFADYGPETGLPVIYLHGLPGSRFEASIWEPEAEDLDLRLIAPDRPGIGLSQRDAKRSLVDYTAQLAELAQHLHLSRFFIVGVSGGGPYALACAAFKEKFVGLEGVAVVVGIGPRKMKQSGRGLTSRLSLGAMDWVPLGAVRWLWDVMVGNKARDEDPKVLEKALRKGLVAHSNGADAELFKEEHILQWAVESIRGAFIQGSEGYVDEASLLNKPWGFDLEDITDINVRLWYGGQDKIAPPAVGTSLAEKIRNSECKIYDDDTHVAVIIRHGREILSDLCGAVSHLDGMRGL